MNNKITSIRLPNKLYSDIKNSVFKEYNITLTDFVIRCMILAKTETVFCDMLNVTYWKYAELLEKKYKQ